jgi:hypothetical protein
VGKVASHLKFQRQSCYFVMKDMIKTCTLENSTKKNLKTKLLNKELTYVMYHTMCINICHYVNFERIYILNAIIIDGLVGFIF